MGTETLAFIGGGNMARALAGGLLGRGWPPGAIRVSDPLAAARDRLRAEFPGVEVLADNLAAAEGAATWVIAVKPQQARDVCAGLAPLAQRAQPLVVSIAAGIPADTLAGWLGPGVAVIRGMPNSPALIGRGITGLHARPDVDAAGRARAGAILGAVGEVVWIADEQQMDAVTAVSGSGPAYVFLMIEMLEAAALAEGLEAATSRQLATATVLGAAGMAHAMGETPAVLRRQVTSPGGTTAAALEVLEQSGIRETFARAVHAATLRSRQLAREFGD